MGLEIGIVLAGRRRIDTSAGPVHYERGRISTIGIGELYSTSYDPVGTAAREIGFLVRLDRVEGEAADTGRLLTFPRRDVADERIVEVAETIADAIDRGKQADPDEVEREVTRFVERHGELEDIDPLERARLELVRYFDRPLYMRHFAEIAGVHEETFSRKFTARYGLTPTRFRLLIRLKEAAVLLATRRHVSVRDVAKLVGFDDLAYFHRAFSTHMGTTPLALARSFSDASASLSGAKRSRSADVGLTPLS